jgi:hypothetical protein
MAAWMFLSSSAYVSVVNKMAPRKTMTGNIKYFFSILTFLPVYRVKIAKKLG